MATNFPSSLDSYTTWVDNTDSVVASIANNVQDAIEAIEAKIGIGTWSETMHSIVYGLFGGVVDSVNKLRLYVYHNTFSVSGWSTVSLSDVLLSVKGGSVYTTGGATAGTWTQPSHTHTGPSHTHSGGSHVHQWYDWVSNSLDAKTYNSSGTLITLPFGPSTSGYKIHMGTGLLDNTLGGDAYTSSVSATTGSGGTGDTGSSATAATYRPIAAVGLIVLKT